MGKAVLMSIHPEHVANIIGGRKIFEYRKVLPSDDVSLLVLYSTSPVMKIVAVAEVIGRVVGSPTHVWNTTAFGAGISRKFFREYFSGQRQAKAFSLGRIFELSPPLDLSSLSEAKVPPQSFSYINGDDLSFILNNSVSTPSVEFQMLFMGGIHGVGKSTICSEIFEGYGYKCVSASSLISAYGRKSDNDKRVDQIDENQSVLLEALNQAKAKNWRLLLDGHFTLINGQGVVEPIDIEVFRAMKPNQLILIKTKPDEIANRLQSRDKKSFTISFLSQFQEAEEAHARYVAKNLGLPLRIMSNNLSNGAMHFTPPHTTCSGLSYWRRCS
jgi:predicted transcriptional regulator/adenylate kinase